jgi:hypothetical protein
MPEINMTTKPSRMNAVALAGFVALWTAFGAAAQTNPEATASQTNTNAVRPHTFIFDGGNPRDFVRAVEKYYGADWSSIAEIPGEMKYAVRIPKLRVPWQQRIYKNRSAEVENVNALITLYNRLAEHRPELGTLVVEGDPLKPSAVMFVPDQTWRKAQSSFKVRAFSLGQIPKSDWAKLRQDIAEAHSTAMDFAQQTGASFTMQGDVNIHESTRLLVATGSETYVDMVGSIVEAYNTPRRVDLPSEGK